MMSWNSDLSTFGIYHLTWVNTPYCSSINNPLHLPLHMRCQFITIEKVGIVGLLANA